MKVLHLITTLDVGGAEMHVLAQVRGQTERGCEVRVAYLKGAGTLRADFERAGAREVLAHPGPFALARAMRGADIVHTHLLKADMLGAALATLAGRRRALVASKHNDEQVLTRGAVSRIHGLLGRLPQRTIVLSDHVGAFIERYGRVPRDRQVRIYYGLDPTPFERAHGERAAHAARVRGEFGFALSDCVFVCVARFAPQKAHDVLLRGFKAARERDARLRLLLVGDDPFGDGRERAQALARELHLEGAVRFAGIRRDVAEIYAASDVFVMTSLWEGLGLVFLEAMASSLPVLATRVSAVPEVVVEGATGVLVEPRDPEGVSRAMLELCAAPELRRQLGMRGRARVLEHFGLARMVDSTLAVYREVLSAGR